jgi:protease PrsW
MITLLLPPLMSLLPVAAFLGVLLYLDSYKLVGMRAVVAAVGAGSAAALIASFLNPILLDRSGMDATSYSRYAAPLVEEGLKSSWLLVLFFRRRIGFLVDAAVYGFAIGTGFSLVENIFYLHSAVSVNPLLWIVRGFGTAIMHGGVTATVGVLARALMDRTSRPTVAAVLPGLLPAMLIHSTFNHFFLSPATTALATIIGVPIVMMAVFRYSEQSTRTWLGTGFDNDQQLLAMLTTGVLSETPVGVYLHTLEERFPPAVVADMLCLLRLHTELSIMAKGVLLLREAGFEPPPDPSVAAALEEMAYLEIAIGKTGLLALQPFLYGGGRAEWQRQLLHS